MISFQEKTFFRLSLFMALFLAAACGRREPTAEETLAEAESFLAAGEFRTAIERLETYDEFDDGHPQIVETLAEAYAAEGDMALSAFHYLRLADITRGDPLPLLFAAGALREAGDVSGAVRAYESYLEEEPEDTAVWRTLAQLHLERGNRQDAIDAFLRSNRHNADGPTQVAIGRLFLEGNNLAQAQSWFASAAEHRDEARPDAFLGLIETALAANRPSDAETVLRQMDEEFPRLFDRSRLAPKRRELAAWRERQDEARRAAEALSRARREASETARHESPPPEAPAAAETAPAEEQTRIARRETESAAEQLREAVEAETARAERRTTPAPREETAARAPAPTTDALDRARRLLEEGDATAAVSAFREALRDDRDNPEVWMGLSEAQLRAGQADWAQASASEAVRRNPSNPVYTMQFLRAAHQSLPPERLIREIERARDRFPESPDINFALARAYDEVGNDPRSARVYYRRYLDLAGPEHPRRSHAEAALRRL
ncbi:MAG: tetratricopeptide repeat protein [Opitutales bacterium]|nr:tetratricopeptide repeat protein [Opitutales bacterium]